MHKGGTGPGGKVQEAWSLDDVVYHTVIKEGQWDKDFSQEGVYVTGLYLEGAKYNKGLEDSSPKILFTLLPVLFVTAVNKKKGGADAERMSQSYSCPVYKYPRRTDRYFIFRVAIPCEGAAKWKLRGVCLLCQTD